MEVVTLTTKAEFYFILFLFRFIPSHKHRIKKLILLGSTHINQNEQNRR